MSRPPAKPKKGGLSNEEKGRILYLLQVNGDSKETYDLIAQDLVRPLNTIKKFIKETKAIFVTEVIEDDTFPLVKKSIIQRVTLNLIHNGITKASAQSKIRKIITSLSEDQQKELTEHNLFQSCLRLTNAGDLMINSSAGGQSGPTIMTGASSERADSQMRNTPPNNPAVFKLTDG